MGEKKGAMAEGCKVYVGNLCTASSVDQHDMEEAFKSFGTIKNVWIARNPPGFAFVTYDDPRDAEDCVREMDGKEMDRERLTERGQRLRVEVSHGKGKGGGGRDRGYDRDRDRGYDRDRDRGYDRDRDYDRRGRDDRRSRSRSRGRDDDRRPRSRSPRRSRSRSR